MAVSPCAERGVQSSPGVTRHACCAVRPRTRRNLVHLDLRPGAGTRRDPACAAVYSTNRTLQRKIPKPTNVCAPPAAPTQSADATHTTGGAAGAGVARGPGLASAGPGGEPSHVPHRAGAAAVHGSLILSGSPVAAGGPGHSPAAPLGASARAPPCASSHGAVVCGAALLGAPTRPVAQPRWHSGQGEDARHCRLRLEGHGPSYPGVAAPPRVHQRRGRPRTSALPGRRLHSRCASRAPAQGTGAAHVSRRTAGFGTRADLVPRCMVRAWKGGSSAQPHRPMCQWWVQLLMAGAAAAEGVRHGRLLQPGTAGGGWW